LTVWTQFSIYGTLTVVVAVGGWLAVQRVVALRAENAQLREAVAANEAVRLADAERREALRGAVEAAQRELADERAARRRAREERDVERRREQGRLRAMAAERDVAKAVADADRRALAHLREGGEICPVGCWYRP